MNENLLGIYLAKIPFDHFANSLSVAVGNLTDALPYSCYKMHA